MTPQPSNGQLQTYLQQANYILDSCGRQVPPKGINFVDIPAHVGYSRLMPGDGVSIGTNDIGGVMHSGRVSFFIRAVTAIALPRAAQGAYWRLRLPSGKYFQNELTAHPMAFGFGSDRQVMLPEIEWKPGEKMFVDLNTIIAGPPPSPGYTIALQFEGVYRFPISGNGISNPLNVDIPRGPNGDAYRYFQDPNQNILAPETYFAPQCKSETPAGYYDEEFWYLSPVVDLPTNGTPVSNINLQIEAASDFSVREIFSYLPGVSPTGGTQGTGSVVARFRRGDGYVMASNFLPMAAIQGPLSIRELLIKGADSLYIDAGVVDGGGALGSVITWGLYLHGVRRRRAS